MNVIQNPVVPFTMPIPGDMSLGKMITVQGMAPPSSNWFAINLLSRSGDIALHVSPKFRENYVARNDFQSMKWGVEERNGTLPIYPGQRFEIIILCEQYDFKIAFNGHHFTEFTHRLPFKSVSNIAVDGEVIVHNVYFKESSPYGNNNVPNSVPYGFQPVPPSPYMNTGGSHQSSPYPTIPHPANSYPSSGPQYSHGPSPYPQQPNYGQVPHQGPYPQVPPPTSGNYTPTPQSKPGFLDQAGMALAGVLGSGLLAKGMKKGYNPQTSTSGRSDFLGQAERTLAGIFGGSGLAGLTRSHSGVTPNPSGNRTRTNILDQAGSALAGVFRGRGLMGSALNGHHKHNKLGGTLGTAVAGAALTGHLNPIISTKKRKKAQKKALKYGLPLAGAGLGAYALHKGLQKGFRRNSSSSSCSSSD